MSETDVSVSSFYNCAELGHCIGLWFGGVWKGGVHVVIDRKDFATDIPKPTRNQVGTSAVAAIDRNFQPAVFDHLNIKSTGKQLSMVLDWVLMLNSRFDLFPVCFGKLSLMKYVQEFFS